MARLQAKRLAFNPEMTGSYPKLLYCRNIAISRGHREQLRRRPLNQGLSALSAIFSHLRIIGATSAGTARPSSTGTETDTKVCHASQADGMKNLKINNGI